jgi:hypothetical protein
MDTLHLVAAIAVANIQSPSFIATPIEVSITLMMASRRSLISSRAPLTSSTVLKHPTLDHGLQIAHLLILTVPLPHHLLPCARSMSGKPRPRGGRR